MSNRNKQKSIAWTLWIPVLMAFILVIVAWVVLIKIASDNPTPRIEVYQPDQGLD